MQPYIEVARAVSVRPAISAAPKTSGTEFGPALVTTSQGTYLYDASDVSGDEDIYRSEMLPWMRGNEVRVEVSWEKATGE